MSEEKVSEARKQMKAALDNITNVWLKDKPFIVGNEITVADLVAATEIEQLGEFCICAYRIIANSKYFVSTSCHRLQPLRRSSRAKNLD